MSDLSSTDECYEDEETFRHRVTPVLLSSMQPSPLDVYCSLIWPILPYDLCLSSTCTRRIKKLILYSHKFHRTKFPNSKKMWKWATFLTLHRIAVCFRLYRYPSLYCPMAVCFRVYRYPSLYCPMAVCFRVYRYPSLYCPMAVCFRVYRYPSLYCPMAVCFRVYRYPSLYCPMAVCFRVYRYPSLYCPMAVCFRVYCCSHASVCQWSVLDFRQTKNKCFFLDILFILVVHHQKGHIFGGSNPVCWQGPRSLMGAEPEPVSGSSIPLIEPSDEAQTELTPDREPLVMCVDRQVTVDLTADADDAVRTSPREGGPAQALPTGAGRTTAAHTCIGSHLTPSAGQWRQCINLRPAGGGGVWTPPPPAVFRGWQENGGAQRRRVFTYLIPHLFVNFCESFDPGSCKVRSPGQVKWPYLTKTLQSRPSYSVWGKVMKLSEYYKVIDTYKMCILDFWYWWP